MLTVPVLLTLSAAAALSLSNPPLLPSLPNLNSTTHSHLTFLGIHCYHLLPATVTLLDCQPLFDSLFQYAHVYQKISIRSGWHLQHSRDPCVIKVESDERGDWRKRVSLSIVEVLGMAIEVLKECQERGTGTGGANVFEGGWRVTVSREVLRRVGTGV